jgi:flagellar basal-body rod modification protein FlgD
MSISIEMSKAELNQVNQKVNDFNTKLKATQEIVSKSELGEADFLKILITQLKTQDPTKPMDDKQFIGQMTQFTSLKQMNRLTENMVKFTEGFTFTKAVALVNKEISWIDTLGALQTGTVDSIKVKAGQTYLNVGGNQVTMEQVTEVRMPGEAPLAADQKPAQPVIINEKIQGDSLVSEGNSQSGAGLENQPGDQQ